MILTLESFQRGFYSGKLFANAIVVVADVVSIKLDLSFESLQVQA